MLEAKNQLGSIILIFITVIVGITLASALGDQIWENVNPLPSTNETVDVSSARGTEAEGNFSAAAMIEISFTNDDLLAFNELRMFNGTVATKDTDYRINLTEGGLTMLDTIFTSGYNTNTTENFTLVDYTFTDGMYLRGSLVSRTILNNLILIFFIVGMVIWVYVKVRDTWLNQM